MAGRVRNLRERLALMRDNAPKFALGIEPLDELTRGGVRVSHTVVIGGAPGAGKSTLMCQMARYLCLNEIPTAILCADEEAQAFDIKNMQSIGIPRNRAEDPGEEEIKLAHDKFKDAPLWLFEDDTTVEEMFEGMVDLYGDKPKAILIDSIQTARTEMSAEIDNLRQRVDDTLSTCKRLARETSSILITTSELSRGSYRSRDAKEQVNDLAAFKESGGIEYAATVAIVLRTDAGGSDIVTASVAKNRLGRRGEFKLKLDFNTASFSPYNGPGVIDKTDLERQADEFARRKAEAGNSSKAGSDRQNLDHTANVPPPLRTNNGDGRRKDDPPF